MTPFYSMLQTGQCSRLPSPRAFPDYRNATVLLFMAGFFFTVVGVTTMQSNLIFGKPITIIGSLLLAFPFVFCILPAIITACVRTCRATRRNRQTERWLLLIIEREKNEGRLHAQIPRETIRLLVFVSTNMPYTERETRILAVLRDIETSYGASVSTASHDPTTAQPGTSTATADTLTLPNQDTMTLPYSSAELPMGTTALPRDATVLWNTGVLPTTIPSGHPSVTREHCTATCHHSRLCYCSGQIVPDPSVRIPSTDPPPYPGVINTVTNFDLPLVLDPAARTLSMKSQPRPDNYFSSQAPFSNPGTADTICQVSSGENPLPNPGTADTLCPDSSVETPLSNPGTADIICPVSSVKNVRNDTAKKT